MINDGCGRPQGGAERKENIFMGTNLFQVL